MRLNRTFLLAMLLWGVLLGCQDADQPQSSQDVSPIAGSFRVAALLPRTIDADDWSRAGYEGLLLVQEELGAEIAYTEAVPEDEFEQVFRQYAGDGYDFIIGHGAQFVAAAEIVADEFPRTSFAVVAIYEGNNRNLGALSMRAGEMAYLTGAVAALKTQTEHVAFLTGVPNNVNQEIAQLFERGVIETNPDVQVTAKWTDSWIDLDKAEQTAQALIADDVDVLLVVAGQANATVHQTAEGAGIYTIGWSGDQHVLAPQAVLTSGIENAAVWYLEGATLARRGRWEGKQYKFGLLENGLYLAPFEGMLSPDEEAAIEDIKKRIIAGEINVIP